MGFFFLPLIELKPNRIASGIPFNLLELQGDFRYPLLFLIVLMIFGLATRDDKPARGWTLAILGNIVILLTLLLPAMAGELLLLNAAEFFDDNVSLRNPRLLPSAAMAAGLIGGYVILYGGLNDLKHHGTGAMTRLLMSFASLPLILFAYSAGSFEVYSIIVEFNTNGTLLGQRFLEHITFVSISIMTGSVIGISLGLWASRDERMAPVILYAVGIIQTIPSLALFGLLLLPLARFGDRLFTEIFGIFAVSLVIAVAFSVGYAVLASRLPGHLRSLALIVTTIAVAVPLALFTMILVSFLFRISLLALTNERFIDLRGTVGGLLLLGVIVWLLLSRLNLRKRIPAGMRQVAGYAPLPFLGVGLVALVVMLFQSSQFFLRNVDSLADLTIRNLGVSGIGVAPALIALTLYALLPLVRNTYAGLNNVDPAIIDSGRGMGMTPAQIFFRIELPLALPVIMAGVRNAGVALVGIGTIASVIGGGGLGDFVLQGIINTSIDLILLGTIPAIILSLILDGGLRAIEQLLTSPGIRQEGA